MKHELILEINVEAKSVFAQRGGAELLRELVADRAWRLDGVSNNGVVAKVLGDDAMIISKAEYEQLKAKVAHYEKSDGK